jgi:hypothetical protein
MIARLVVSLFAIALLAGCQSGPGISVQVKAEPKAGYRMPDQESYAGMISTSQHDHDYHLIDYNNLTDIVVWVEPVGQPAPTTPRNVRVAAGVVSVASVGDTLEFKLSDIATASYFIRSASGEITAIASQNPTYVAKKAGVLELVGNDSDDAAATILVVPTNWAKTAVGGQRLNFAPLSAGQYRVTAWHPILPGSSQVVEVAPSKMTNVKLTVGVNSLPKPK